MTGIKENLFPMGLLVSLCAVFNDDQLLLPVQIQCTGLSDNIQDIQYIDNSPGKRGGQIYGVRGGPRYYAPQE